MATTETRDLRAIPTLVPALVAIGGIVVGTAVLAPGDLGFSWPAALGALVTWAPVTLPPIVVVLAASLLDLAAGIALASIGRRRPFADLSDAILEGAVWAVLLDAVLLGLLAGAGLFRAPILIAAHVAVLAAGLVRGPILDRSAFRPTLRPSPMGALLVVAWAAPILLMLASPVVPFMDVLPNHVAPAEHLRTFGGLTFLTDTQSPIYGPSRSFVGYDAVLGGITTMTGLPAGGALAGFVLPSTLLAALAVARLARSVGGPTAVPWALLVFAMTTPFARLGDARATVVVLPLAVWAIATLAERVARAEGQGDAGVAPAPAGRLPPSVVLGLGIGAAALVHPVIGFLTALTCLVAVLAAPGRTADVAIPALGTAAIVALPQAATMAGIALPPVALTGAILVAIGLGLALDRLSSEARLLVAWAGRMIAGGTAFGALLLAGPVVRAAVAGASPLVQAMELALVASLGGVALRAGAARSLVLWSALAAGFGLATLTQLVPEKGSGLLGDAIRFELPKTLHYWVPVFMTILAAGGIDAVVRHRRLPAAVRGLAVATFVAAAALPIRSVPIDALHLGEHRLAETFSIAMRWAQSGFWQGYPDVRYVLDQPRREIVDAVRTEIGAGRLGRDTPVLHVAGSFQQWVATPLGVFAGVTETDVTTDAVQSIHTVGGRLRPVGELPALLAEGSYPYLLFEPDVARLSGGIVEAITAAGYAPIFANDQGTLFARAHR